MPTNQNTAPAAADYLFAAARIHALEARLLTQEQYGKLIDAPKGAEGRLLSEFGYPKGDGAAESGRIEARVAEAYAIASDAVNDPTVFDALRYVYDGNNLKAALKCSLRTGFRAEDYMIPLGTVPTDAVTDAVRTGDFSAMPAHMAAAAEQAVTQYAEDGDPTGIDRAIDAACFLDRKDAAERANIDALKEYVSLQADTINAVTRLRTTKATFPENALPGGTVPTDALTACDDGALDASAFAGTALAPIAEKIAAAESATALEALLDAFMMETVRPYQTEYFDASPLVGFLLASEAEARNVRLILAARDAGLPAETIRERMRESYV